MAKFISFPREGSSPDVFINPDHVAYFAAMKTNNESTQKTAIFFSIQKGQELAQVNVALDAESVKDCLESSDQ